MIFSRISSISTQYFRCDCVLIFITCVAIEEELKSIKDRKRIYVLFTLWSPFRSERYRQQDFTNKKKPAASACTVSLFCQRRPTQAWQQAIFAGQEEQLKELTNTVRKLDPATAWPYQELLLRTSTFISFWQKLSKSILRDWSMDISFLQISSCSSLFLRCCVQNFVLWHWRWWWCP